MRSLPSVFGQRLAAAEESLRSWPARAALPHLRERVGQEIRALLDRLAARLASARERLGIAAGSLGALDPLRVLARGYAVAYKEGEPAPLTSAGSVAPGDRVRVLLARGEIGARVTDVGNDEERTRRGNREEVER